MKVNELIALMGNNKNKMLKGEQLQQLISKTIEVKKYISIKEKRALVENIINNCIVYEDGVYKFDEIDKYIVFTMKSIEAYTNLELSDDMEDDYDSLCEAKLLNFVIEAFSGEYENVKLLLQMKCDYILSGNTIEAQFGKFLTGIMDEVSNLVDVVEGKVDDFDLSNLPINISDISKLMEFVNFQKK